MDIIRAKFNSLNIGNFCLEQSSNHRPLCAEKGIPNHDDASNVIFLCPAGPAAIHQIIDTGDE